MNSRGDQVNIIDGQYMLAFKRMTRIDIVAVILGVRFMLRGTYVIEFDDVFIGIRRIGAPWSRWNRFAWNDISKLGFFKRLGLGTSGALAIFSRGRHYSFGADLRHE